MEALEQIQVSKSLGVVYLFVRIGLVLLWVQEQNFGLYDVGIMMFGPTFPFMRWGFTCPLLIFLSYFCQKILTLISSSFFPQLPFSSLNWIASMQSGQPFDKVAQTYSEDKAKGKLNKLEWIIEWIRPRFYILSIHLTLYNSKHVLMITILLMLSYAL